MTAVHVVGVQRNPDQSNVHEQRVLLVHLSAPPTDDDMRGLHDFVRSWNRPGAMAIDIDPRAVWSAMQITALNSGDGDLYWNVEKFLTALRQRGLKVVRQL